MALSRLQQCVEHYWYSQPGPLWLLYPFEVLYRIASRVNQTRDSKKQTKLTVPVLVIGNISVGGTGKTPALISLLNFLVSKGLKPGVISRGYGRGSSDPVIVNDAVVDERMLNQKTNFSRMAGDEPLLVFRETGCPVSIHRDRQYAATCLLKAHPECDVILADDGLQHYKLKRDFELVLIDAERKFGNGHLLPLGPLREAPARLNRANWILVNNKTSREPVPEDALSGALVGNKKVFSAQLKNTGLFSVVNEQEQEWEQKSEIQLENLSQAGGDGKAASRIVALSAIGNPQSFYKNLRTLISDFDIATFKDHHQWTANEIAEFSGKILVCTSKDAIKLRELAKANPKINAARWYYLKVELTLPEELKQEIYTAIINCKN